jgi:hypothetical protein
MASFGMVYSGAPLFIWIWAVRVAVFVNNITASYFSREKVWATPYELVHGEPFPDASIVVPFGCAALILLDEHELKKFAARCALMVFIHYVDEHPLYTHAFYSPRTKRVLYRQDCIFLTGVFTMRHARRAAGLNPDGEPIVPFRSPPSMRGEGDSNYSFENWSVDDPLPQYDDHVSGVELSQPFSIGTLPSVPQIISGHREYHFPFHPAFGSASVVKVHIPAGLYETGKGKDDTASGISTHSSGAAVDTSFTTDATSDCSTFGPALPDSSFDDGDDAPLQPSFPIVDPGSGGISFTITLDFFEQGLPRQRCRVFSAMTVPSLYQRIASSDALSMISASMSMTNVFFTLALLLTGFTRMPLTFPRSISTRIASLTFGDSMGQRIPRWSPIQERSRVISRSRVTSIFFNVGPRAAPLLLVEIGLQYKEADHEYQSEIDGIMKHHPSPSSRALLMSMMMAPPRSTLLMSMMMAPSY